MNGTGGPARRPGIDLRSSRVRVAAGVIAGAAVVALLGQALLTGPRPSPSGPIAAASPSGGWTARPTSGPSTTPEATEGPWADLEVPPYEPVAELVPSDTDRLGVASTATFEVRAKNGASGVALARGLTVRPAIQFAVKAGSDPTRAIVRPTVALQPGTRYRWQLTATDGSLAGSWLFTVRQPIHVVTTLPGDKATGVPLNTGIEVTFDQDGTTSVADRVTIDPAVAGRFEQHGRTWSFVPEHALAARTIYTVTVRAGVPVTGSSETLASDVSFRFETGSATQAPPRVDFERPILEIRPGTQPVAMLTRLDIDEEKGQSGPGSYTVDVYRLPTFAAALDAARRLSGNNGWAIASPAAIVATSGLTRVDHVTSPTYEADSGTVLTIPATLGQGWYLLQIDQPSGPAQLLLQVTNVAAYALLTTETLVVWANDLATGDVLPDAAVSSSSGKVLGTTTANGTVRIAASAVDVAPRATYDESPRPATLFGVKAPDGRSVIVALGMPFAWGYDDVGIGIGGSGSPYWTLFRTDRETYRQTDTIHVSGLLRLRSDRSVPSDVRVELLPADGGSDVPLGSVPVTLSARGVFTADVPIVDLPRAGYRLQLLVHGSPVSSLWFTVAEIRKPAYRIDVSTDRVAYHIGDKVQVSAIVTFYDGTAAPGLDLQLTGLNTSATGTTDASGRLTATITAAYDPDNGSNPSGWSTTWIGAYPLRPEEGQISGEASVALFPSRVWVTAKGVLTASTLSVDGSLSWADLDRWERANAAGDYLDDPTGAPIAGSVTVKVSRYVERRTQTGTRYDFIEKKVVPEYEVTTDTVAVGSYPAKSDASGTWHLSVGVPSPDDTYEVVVTAKDPEGRVFEKTFEVSKQASTSEWRVPYIGGNAGYGCGFYPNTTVGLGERFDASLHAADGSLASGGRFLFVVSRQGSVDVVVQDSATFKPTFEDRDLPSLDVVAVWQHQGAFDIAGLLAGIDPKTKQIRVAIAPDAARYRPGDTVTVQVTTTGPGGGPIAADVILQGVDEKLYTLGQTWDQDPTADLFAATGSGIVQSFATHASPVEGPGGCGGAGGGSADRADFRDVATFQRITTDASGHGTASFRVPDDLTSWHLTATAAASNLDVGQASLLIPVGLDFFAEPVLAPEYLAGDQPVLRIRGYGDALAAADQVRYLVTSPALNLNATATATAFTDASVPLPALATGRYAITIAAEATHGGRVYRDSLVRTITVVPSRLTALTSTFDALTAGYAPKGGGPGMTTYLITDAGRGSLIALLQQLASTSSARFDSSAAADLARSILVDDFGVDPEAIPTSGYDAGRYQSGGITLLPYASPDLQLSALAALTVPTRLNASELSDWLENGGEEQTTRERDIVVLAARASLGADVAAALQAIDPSSLTIREQLWLGLGLAAVGDDAGARAIERDLLDKNGQRLGQWVRLQVGSSREDSLEATGLLLLLAGRLGDPLGADAARYLMDQPSKEHVFPLQLAAYAASVLERLPRVAGKFAYTIDGTRREVALEPGGSFTLSLVPSQVASLRLEPLEGKLDVVTSWQTSDVPATNQPSVSVTRTVTPASTTTDGKLVRVTLTVAFGPQAPLGCYVLTDLLPSGLAPVAATVGWDTDEQGNQLIGPYEVDGQRVSWCVSPNQTQRTFGYAARVVTPGTYRWEPAVIQALAAPELRSATTETTFTIR